VQVRDYTVVKSVLHSNTADTHEWVQESRLFLHARADPTRRVQMDIRYHEFIYNFQNHFLL
jgi:hypothetical protein